MKTKDPDILIKKLLNNQISGEELNWFIESIDDPEIGEKYTEILKSEFFNMTGDHLFDPSPKGKQESQPNDIIRLINRRKKKKNHGLPKNIYRAAASIIFFATLYLAFDYTKDKYPDLYHPFSESSATSSPDFLEKSAPRGMRSRIQMTDGSFIHLNADSKITFPSDMQHNDRDVSLQGEAYFDVSHSRERPFRVTTHDLVVEVLGTSFDIKSYPEDEYVTVTVESGKVAISLPESGNKVIHLEKDQQLVYYPNAQQFEKLTVNAAIELDWREGILRFDHTSMLEVERILERWYGIDVDIQDKQIYKKKLSGLHKNENLVSVLESLSYALKTNYELNGMNVKLKN
jgi:hypothetical protein